MLMQHPGRVLAEFAAGLRLDEIPAPVQRRAEELFLDWFACALAGKGAPPVEVIARFAESMGPGGGPCEILVHRTRSSPLMAAMANAAASHFVEQDDVHNGSVFHPGTVVFPPALAVAQALGASGGELLTAVVAGYEVGIRVGEFLGRTHYKIFHTTGTAGTFAAAAAAGRLLHLSSDKMLHAFGSAGTQSSGLWEFLREAADSKQLHTAHAAGAGLSAAYLAAEGLTGASRILDGSQGLAAGTSSDADASRLTDGLGKRWALAETSFKYHASCRHTHPAADALQRLVAARELRADDMKHVTARVHQAAIDVLGPVADPQSVHQSKFSMGTVLALIALHGRAGLSEFDAYYRDPQTIAFRGKVDMALDHEVEAAYPTRWIGKVEVETTDGMRFAERVDEPLGDPGNTLSREQIEDKALRLAAYRGGADREELMRVMAIVWKLTDAPQIPIFLDQDRYR